VGPLWPPLSQHYSGGQLRRRKKTVLDKESSGKKSQAEGGRFGTSESSINGNDGAGLSAAGGHASHDPSSSTCKDNGNILSESSQVTCNSSPTSDQGNHDSTAKLAEDQLKKPATTILAVLPATQERSTGNPKEGELAPPMPVNGKNGCPDKLPPKQYNADDCFDAESNKKVSKIEKLRSP
jgi:hypothetical protein